MAHMGGFTEGVTASHGHFTNFQVGDMDGLKCPLQHMAFRSQGQGHAAPCHLIWAAVKELFQTTTMGKPYCLLYIQIMVT